MNFQKLRRAFSILARALMVPDRTNPPPPAPFILYSCHDVDRSVIEDGKRFSPLLEGISRLYGELGYGAMNLTHPFASIAGRRIKGDSITLNYRTLMHRLRARLGKGERARIALEAGYYSGLLERISPTLVMSIQPPYGLCVAARELGIPIVEALHGTSYVYGDPFFAPHMAKPDRWLPEFLLSFDDITQATMETYCAGRDIVPLRVNDPWRAAVRLRGAAAQKGDALEKNAGRRVLVSLQWGYDNERDTLSNIIPNGIIHPALEAAFAMPEVEFLVRAHPIQVNRPGYRHHRRYVAALSERFPNVEWEWATTQPLPLVLDQVDAHITMSSSTVGEAALADVPSLALCPTLQEGGSNFGLFRDWGDMITFGILDTGMIEDWISSIPLREHHIRADPEVEQREQLAFFSELLDRVKKRAARGAVTASIEDAVEH
jgi:hypothetical protein